tara:strand:- start:1248 stop:1538 length:291 start_codon:yes stop_codon:yes gene_type:complete
MFCYNVIVMAKKTPKNLINRRYVQVKAPILHVPTGDDGKVCPIIMEPNFMDSYEAEAKELGCKIVQCLMIEKTDEVLLEFPTPQQAMMFALKYTHK